MTTTPQDAPDPSKSSLAPIGRLGFRGRQASPEERARIFDAFFFEGDRRIPYLGQFLILMLLSATIAAFGLTNDSAAVVIGAMLVAPLMTPILGTAASLVQGWGHRMAESFAIVLGGAAVAIGVGIVVAFIEPRLFSGAPLPGELLARTRPNVTDLGIAIAAGAAGAFVTVRSEASSALPGVGISVALVPPLATVGMTLGLGAWDLAGGAALLFTTNLVAIILTSGIVFTLAGFAANRDRLGERRARIAAVVLFAAMIALFIPLGTHGLQQFESGKMTATAMHAVSRWAPDLALESVDLDSDSDHVTVRVIVTGTGEPPQTGELAEMLAQDFGRAVVVEIAFDAVDAAKADSP